MTPVGGAYCGFVYWFFTMPLLDFGIDVATDGAALGDLLGDPPGSFAACASDGGVIGLPCGEAGGLMPPCVTIEPTWPPCIPFAISITPLVSTVKGTPTDFGTLAFARSWGEGYRINTTADVFRDQLRTELNRFLRGASAMQGGKRNVRACPIRVERVF